MRDSDKATLRAAVKEQIALGRDEDTATAIILSGESMDNGSQFKVATIRSYYRTFATHGPTLDTEKNQEHGPST